MPEPAHPPKSTLLIVFLVVFIDLLGFGIVLPIMPRLAQDYLHGTPDNIKGVVIGVLFSAFSLMQFLFAPMWGRISDRIGRRPILLLGLLGSVVFYALFGFAVTLPSSEANLAVGLMLLSRIGAGIAGATIGTAAATIADCTTPETRARGMALIGIAFGCGFALGPLIAFFGMELFDNERWAVGAIASILSACALLLAIMKLPETRRKSEHTPERAFFSISRTLGVIKSPSVGPLVVIYFLVIFAFANFEATLALFTGTAFGYSEKDNYLVFAFIGFVLLFAGGAYRPIVKKRPEALLLKLGVALLFAGMGVLVVIASAIGIMRETPGIGRMLVPLFYIACAVSVIGFAFVNPSVSSLVSRRSDPNRQGEVLGVNQGCASLARILGPLCGSIVFYLERSHVLPYALACLTLVLVIMLLPMVNRPAEPQPE